MQQCSNLGCQELSYRSHTWHALSVTATCTSAVFTVPVKLEAVSNADSAHTAMLACVAS
jgi:hypothetical protein